MTRLILVAALAALAACGDRAPNLLTFTGTQTGPDEFLVVPSKPLETPEELAVLPPPTPGAANRADPTPEGDAVAALGGRPERLARDARVAETGLVAHASRFGRDGDIRETLAEEDLAFRRRNDGLFLERALNRNLYFDAYASQSLNQQAERARLRRAGVATPEAPPPAVE